MPRKGAGNEGLSRACSRRPKSALNECFPGRSRLSGPISPTPKKRGEWLASGPMEPRVGGKLSLRFKHAELSPKQAPPPERFKKMDAEGHQRRGDGYGIRSAAAAGLHLGRHVGGGVRAGATQRRQGAADPHASQVAKRRRADRHGRRMALPSHDPGRKTRRPNSAGLLGRLQEDRRGIRQRYSAIGGVTPLRPRSRRSGRRPGSTGRCAHRAPC